jgi:CHAT domain
MQTVTIRIPQRTSVKDPFTVEWYLWKDGSLKGVRSRKLSAPAGLTGEKNNALKTLKTSLQGATPLTQLRQQGRDIAAAVFGGANWSSLQKEYRIYLDVEDKSLRDIPWEMLEETLPLSWQKGRYIIRSLTKDLPVAAPIERRPFKVLLFVALGPTDRIGGRVEAGKLKRLFWQVDHSFDCALVDAARVPVTTSGDLAALLNEHKPDIFHFIGHGDASSLQVYNSASTQTWDWTASDIRISLQRSAGPRVVYLNACRSQQNGGSLDMGSVAAAFLAEGTMATISMQADVEGASAVTGARAFYEALAAGLPLDAAVQESRVALDNRTKDPYLPVLTVSQAAETILPERAELELERSRAVSTCKNLKSLDAFIDRHTDRRVLIRNFLRSDTEPTNRYSAAVIEGASKAGKTWFCWWWVRMCVWQRIPVYYVVPPDPKDLKDLDWLEYVRHICEGDPSFGALSPALPGDAVRQFNWELEQIYLGKEAPFSEAPAGFKDPRRTRQEILAAGRAGNDFSQRVLACFHDALRRAARNNKLMLVCDEWLGNAGFGASDVTTLSKYLFEPIAEDPSGPVRLIVVLPDATVSGADGGPSNSPFRDVRFSHAWHPVRIDNFDYRGLRELTIEYVERRYADDSTEVFEKINAIQDSASPKVAIQLIDMLVRSLRQAPATGKQD